MLLPANRSLLIFLAMSVSATAHGGERPTERPVRRNELAPAREAVRELAREVEYLQEEIVADLSGQKERTLYRQADAVLASVTQVQQMLEAGAPRGQLSATFEPLDRKTHELLQAVQALAPQQRALRRAANRVGAAEEQLYYTLSEHDKSDARKREVLERQTRALVTAAGQLERTADYTLGTVQGHGTLIADLKILVDAAERFQKGLAGRVGREQLRKDFGAVEKAWVRAIRSLRDLKPQENIHLLNSASRVDRLHERLFRLLGLEGKCPHLIIRT